MKRKKLYKRIAISSILSSSLFFIVFSAPFFQRMEYASYDRRMQMIQGSNHPSGNVALVFICDETLSLLGEWPIDREWFAVLTDILVEMGARGIVFDILFVEERGESDMAFASAVADAGNVILPFYFISAEYDEKSVFKASGPIFPLRALERAAHSTGFINCPRDIDGIIRRYPVAAESGGVFLRSLGAESAAVFIGGYETSPYQPSVLLNFHHDLKKFPNYSFVQVFQSYLYSQQGKEPVFGVDAFKDKVVIIGSVATGASDAGPVAGMAEYPLLGVHASFLENLLQDRFIRKAGNNYNFLSVLIFSVASGVSASLPVLWSVFSVVVLISAFILLSIYLFSSHLLWVYIMPVIFSVVAVYIYVTVSGLFSERREKLKVKTLFSRYVSGQLLDKLLLSPDSITLEGEKKKLTVLFADIRGFTSFAEEKTPEETFSFLNELLSVMSDSVFRYGGMLDKYIGDEVMAVFGAPAEDPCHALNAVLSAVEMINRLGIFAPHVKIGVGINTGEMIIGNVGTEKRMEYTAIGDNVNLASRIEELTGGGDILIGEETYNAIKEKVSCVFAGKFVIKGKKKEVSIYRVIYNEEGACFLKTKGGGT